MSTRKLLPAIFILAIATALKGQSLDESEVRLSYGELRRILARSEAGTPAPPAPTLVSAHLRLSLEKERLVIDATFRVISFGGDPAFVPLAGGDFALTDQDPQDAVVVVENDLLCLAVDEAGSRTVRCRLLPTGSADAFSLDLPACPSVILEIGDVPADRSVVFESGNKEEMLVAGEIRPVSHSARSLRFRLLDMEATREALRPPEPSIWSWQHQALVLPGEGELLYQVIARASASGGSGMSAVLPMPPDARDVAVTGEDLTSFGKTRSEDGTSAVSLVWKTRGILDRRIHLSYRMPLRPLDRTWRLRSPGGEDTRTLFIIASSPLLAYSATGLSAPVSSQGLPTAFIKALAGGNCHHLEAATAADLSLTAIPVAATAEGVVNHAAWNLKIEPDGATLATGVLTIEHQSSLDFLFDTPAGMKLLSCELGGVAIAPVDLGEGRLQVTLPASGEKSLLTCSFTGRGEPLDPVEGTVALGLPKTPLFIHSLLWHVELPATYQAETHGNLTRIAGEPPPRVTLKKNLCRDERPEVQIFYQRSDLNR